MPLTYGGGVDTTEKAKNLVDIGFEKISICTQAFNEDFISELSDQVGMQSIVLNFDYRSRFWVRELFLVELTNKLSQQLILIIDGVTKLGLASFFQSVTNDGRRLV